MYVGPSVATDSMVSLTRFWVRIFSSYDNTLFCLQQMPTSFTLHSYPPTLPYPIHVVVLSYAFVHTAVTWYFPPITSLKWQISCDSSHISSNHSLIRGFTTVLKWEGFTHISRVFSICVCVCVCVSACMHTHINIHVSASDDIDFTSVFPGYL